MDPSDPQDTGGPRLHVVTSLVEVLKQPVAPLRWVVPGLVPEGGFIVLAGPQKSRKTWLAMDIAVAVAAGQPVLDRPTLQGPTLYVLEEGAVAATIERYRRICERRGVPVDAYVALRQGVRIDDPRRWAGIRADVTALHPTLTVFDPAVRLHGGDENSATDVSRLTGALLELTVLGTAVLLVHHVVKHAEGLASLGAAARGSSALVAASDGNLLVSRAKRRPNAMILASEMRDAEGERLTLGFDGARAEWRVLSSGDEDRSDADEAPPTLPGGIAAAKILALATAASDGTDLGSGLDVAALRGQLRCSEETARQALQAATRQGLLRIVGPRNHRR